ncbi:MAG: DUF3089 domain-containing protein [Parabacteroides sp.]|nr:DUF3089 domain-containing protein [Parabacteroides sp.]
MMKYLLHVIVLLFVMGMPSCRNSKITTIHVPAAPDYTDTTMWHIALNEKDKGADVFFVVSTWEFDWYTADSVISHHADTWNPTHRENMNIEISKIAKYMADGNNFYSPYYRHITLDSWATLNEDTINRRFHDVAFVDIKKAFDHFQKNFNQGRPFVLAGFSQGGKAVVELIKIMPEAMRERMVAAYVLGYKVTPTDVEQAPWLIAAQDSIDTGVIICYNSVSDVKYVQPVISAPNVMCINPVNWHTDDTPAILQDTITVTVSPEHKVLVLEGFDDSNLTNILNFLNVGDYHSIEPWVYSECLHKNIKQRIEAFYKEQ